jgi:hypothetical protein
MGNTEKPFPMLHYFSLLERNIAESRLQPSYFVMLRAKSFAELWPLKCFFSG